LSATALACAALAYFLWPSAVSQRTQVQLPDTTAVAESAGEILPDEAPAPRSASLVQVTPAEAAELPAPGRVYTPVRGTAERSAILGGIRAATGIRNLFRVRDMRVSGTWAYVRCTELEARGDDLRETDREIAALLERVEGTRRWRVIELWNRGADAPFARFAERVREVGREREIPSSLLPPAR
jgi:hypothetical protein